MGVLFIGLTYLAALVEPPRRRWRPGRAVFAIARDIGGPTLAGGLLVLSVAAVIGNVLLPQTAVARIVAVMAREGRLPGSRQLATIDSRSGVPVVATLTVTAVALLLALFLPLTTTIALVNCGALSAFLLLNLAVPARFLRHRPRTAAALIRYGLLPPGGACVVGYVLLFYPVDTYLAAASWLLVGGPLTALTRRQRRLRCDPVRIRD
jgi:amino acid transporter